MKALQSKGKQKPFALAAVAGSVLVGAAAGYVCTFPASQAANLIDHFTHGHVQIANATGSIWNGRGNLVLSGGQQSAISAALPSPLEWRVGISTEGVRLSLRASCCTDSQPVVTHISFSQARIEPLNMRLPLAITQGLGAPWNTLKLGGSANLRSSGLVVSWKKGKQEISGEVHAVIDSTTTQLTTLPEVGSYELKLQANGGAPQLNLSTIRGPLMLNGQGRWDAARFTFNGQAQAEAQSSAALSNLLTLIGERRGNKTMIRLG